MVYLIDFELFLAVLFSELDCVITKPSMNHKRHGLSFVVHFYGFWFFNFCAGFTLRNKNDYIGCLLRRYIPR